ncbi:AAA family ATPase [Enterococcus rivorum]|uniref:Chromosome segregation protein SMC n=1 Tax=Enterococcus rivorum TaxID=762845 RepID=A0A1E5KSZ3_9ENTE|nr:ATP-binding protein [Enterococcus rivorum]MBP2098045.1 AAA15 family ATPase/GTPase [Enterococcus rivorum]OEH80994.1 chromosome segregation protein SMC [Enterococcus rivorum]
MIKYFEVQGFKSFSKKISIDFSDVGDYQFNQKQCIKENMLNKIIVYGKNAVGKSNLGLAIFDITAHLVDKNIGKDLYDYYLNADSYTEYATFRYNFIFDNDELEYVYRKDNVDNLLFEKVSINGDLLFSYDFSNMQGDFTEISKQFPSLNFEFNRADISILRYIVNNSIIHKDHILKRTVDFVSNMLWVRSLDQLRFVGHKTSAKDYRTFIFEDNNLEEFKKLLTVAGINENIIIRTDPTGELGLYFEKNELLPFFKVASNGTKALYSIFYWLKTSRDISFFCIDEFDAYYHFELSETLVRLLEREYSFQMILTTHNTNLLSNSIMRPDCYFILTPTSLTPFFKATNRELKEGHNLEKLYMSGEFGG